MLAAENLTEAIGSINYKQSSANANDDVHYAAMKVSSSSSLSFKAECQIPCRETLLLRFSMGNLSENKYSALENSN